MVGAASSRAEALGPSNIPVAEASADGFLTAGLDLGSTGLKLLVRAPDERELVGDCVPTPWRHGVNGTTEMDATHLLDAVQELFWRVGRRLVSLTDAPVAAIGISGMGESGFLVDSYGDPAGPAFAWFDPRGLEQVESFPSEIRAEFSGRTGLPLGAQVTVAKLAFLKDQGLSLVNQRWLNMPDFVAVSLGGEVLVEQSLASRTGLVDLDTGCAWPGMLDFLGARGDLLPTQVVAGTRYGRVSKYLSGPFSRAQITVAGHDHLVGAEARGELPTGQYHVSMGTAEVLLRVIDSPLGFTARQRLSGHLINEVRHIVPGKHVLVAGVKTGLLLRRTLQAVGINDAAGRSRLDAEMMSAPFEGQLPEGGVEVTGARNDDGVLRLVIRTDEISPAELCSAVLRHSNDEISSLIDAIDRELPPARTSVLTGGWASMRAVRRARSRILPHLEVSEHEQETAMGAAHIAARMLTQRPVRPELQTK